MRTRNDSARERSRALPRLLRWCFGVGALALTTAATACSDAPLPLTSPAEGPGPAGLIGSAADPRFSVATTAVNEPFDTWNSALWSKGDHALGLGYLYPANVSVQNSALVLTTPANTFDGGEILTTSQYGYGTYTASLNCHTPGGTVCAFFLYQGVRGTQNDEIDIELLGGTNELWVTTWVRGRRTNQQQVLLGFDPSVGYHTYQIHYTAAAVEARVDDKLVARFTRKLPTKAMYIMANAWWPTWLSGTSNGGDMSIDWITSAP